MPQQKPLKTKRVNVRLEDDVRARLETLRDRHGLSFSKVVHDAVVAACEYIERNNGRYVRPVQMVFDEQARIVAEKAGPYHTKTTDPPGGSDKQRRRRGDGPNHPLPKTG